MVDFGNQFYVCTRYRCASADVWMTDAQKCKYKTAGGGHLQGQGLQSSLA